MSDFPFLKQADTMDCGPACLQMVAKYYGKDHDLSMLSNLIGLSRRGASLLGISEAAERIGFNTLSIKVTIEKIREQELLPCIAHWRENHFIVVYKVTEDKIFVADPANGLLEYPTGEFIEKWAIPGDEAMRGIVLLLELK